MSRRAALEAERAAKGQRASRPARGSASRSSLNSIPVASQQMPVGPTGPQTFLAQETAVAAPSLGYARTSRSSARAAQNGKAIPGSKAVQGGKLAPGKAVPANRMGFPSVSGPQLGIAGVMAVATIVTPLSGAMAAPKAANQALPVAAMAPAPVFPAKQSSVTPGITAVQVVAPAGVNTAAAPEGLAAPRTLLVTRATRDNERPVLPGCDGVFEDPHAPNGQLPRSSLCTLWDPDHRLRPDAAVALAKLNVAYKQRFGNDICLTDSYRTLAEQESLRDRKPGLAATPGRSNHGWGAAVDLCDDVDSYSSPQYKWLRDVAPDYGWDNPEWARGGGNQDEPWHWEFLAAAR